MMQIQAQKWIATILASVMLSACSTPIVAPITNKVEKHARDAQLQLVHAQRGLGAVRADKGPSVEFVPGVWIPTTKVPDPNKMTLAKNSSNRRISINQDFRGLTEIAERLMVLTGLRVTIAADTKSAPSVGATPTMPSAMPSPIALPTMAGSVMPTAIKPFPSSSVRGSDALQYDGPLSGFLDIVAGRFGISWDWSGSGIHFFKTTTQTFHVVAVPGDTTLQNSISSSTGTSGSASASSGGSASGGSTGSSSVGGSSSTTGVSFSGLSVWTALNEAIKGMLSQSGSVSVSAATGTVTVTDTPQVLARVASFIEAQNVSLSKQVVVNVRVLSVDLNDRDEYGINWNLLHTALSGNFGFGLSNTFAANANASNLALKVLGSPGAGNSGNANVKAWNGSQAIISALSAQGHVSQITSASLMTSNNQPAPLQVGTQQSYLQASATTQTANVGSTSTLTPGLITTGFSMSVVPNIMEKGKLMLQYAINISSLIEMTTVSSGGSTIQTPSIDTRNFMQRVTVNSGDTIVMTGFEQASLYAKAQGVGNANNFALGGGVQGSNKRSILVILIQPIVGDS